jgi:hypothetical protein
MKLPLSAHADKGSLAQIQTIELNLEISGEFLVCTRKIPTELFVYTQKIQMGLFVQSHSFSYRIVIHS